MMQVKTSLSDRELQKIKVEEFESFFDETPDYLPYLNHLGELKWMTEEEADQQHEFFEYDESPIRSLKKKLKFRRNPSYDKLPAEERELRLQFRKYLEETYYGRLRSETASSMPRVFSRELSAEEIDHIPVTLAVFEQVSWGKSITAVFAILLVLGGVLAWSLLSTEAAPTGNMLVNTNIEGARVFVDGVQLGYSDRLIAQIEPGTRRISVAKAGFSAVPPFINADILADTTTEVKFRLTPISSTRNGYVIIQSSHSDSKIFVNNDFYGTLSDQPVLALPEGDHRILIEKSGFQSSPREQNLSVVPGDTQIVSFNLVRARRATNAASGTSTRAARSTGIGSLDISSNIHGGRIILNGEDTGKQADYIFSNVQLGTYRVQVEREGYRSVPAEKVVTLTADATNADLSFKLIKEFQQVSITTSPAEGQIFVDGELVGKGMVDTNLKLGKHEVTFGDLEGYRRPGKRTINVDDYSPVSLKVHYAPIVALSSNVDGQGNLKNSGLNATSGYSFSNRGFTPSNEAGPEIQYKEELDDYFWKLGYAFPYRNPKGNDALQFSFSLPRDMKASPKYILRLHAAASKEKYPLTLSGTIDVKIKLNGKILTYYYQPKFLEDLQSMEKIDWDITNFVKPGLNSIVISTTDKNNTYYFVKKVEVLN